MLNFVVEVKMTSKLCDSPDQSLLSPPPQAGVEGVDGAEDSQDVRSDMSS